MGNLPKINQEILQQIHSHEKMSDKYKHIKTSDVIQEFEARGFEITSFQQANTRVAHNENKQRHVVRMAQSTDIALPERSEVVIMNSYNGSSSLKLHLGAYRVVCANGMIVGDDEIEPARIMHSKKDWDFEVYKFLKSFASNSKKQQENIERMKKTYMSFDREMEFAYQAALIREKSIEDILDPKELIIAKREADVGQNLWLTFNKTQENLIQGNFTKIFERANEQEIVERITQKASIITDSKRNMQINSDLGKLALSYME